MSSAGGVGRAFLKEDDGCCPGTADPYTLLGVLGAIGAATFFLRNAIIQNITAGRRRRRRSIIVSAILQGQVGKDLSLSFFLQQQATCASMRILPCFIA